MENLKKRDNESKEEFIARVYDSKVKNNLNKPRNPFEAIALRGFFGTHYSSEHAPWRHAFL